MSNASFTTHFSLIFLIALLLPATISGWGNNDKVKLKDVSSITLYQGRMTTSRRSYPVPQLKCVGGTAGCREFLPQVVQCQNKGYDGSDVQWECKTDMDNAYRFGKIEVVCEGYDYPDDPYILKGSCGLEYTLDFTKEGLNRKRSGNSHNYYYDSHSAHPNYITGKQSTLASLVGLAIIALVIFAIYRTCIANNQYSTTSGDYPDPYGRQGGSFGSGGSAPPPPGFRQEYYPNDSCGGTSRPHASGDGGGGGFWTGAATGGLLGYLFGSRNNYSTSGYSYRQPSPPSSSWGWGGSGSGSGYFQGDSGDAGSTGTRTASGFGGTRRR